MYKSTAGFHDVKSDMPKTSGNLSVNSDNCKPIADKPALCYDTDELSGMVNVSVI